MTRYLDRRSRPQHFNSEERYRFLSSILESFTATLELKEVLRRIVTITRQEFGADRAWLLHPVNEKAEIANVRFAVSSPEYAIEPDASVSSLSLKNSANLIRRLLEADGPITVSRRRSRSRHRARRAIPGPLRNDSGSSSARRRAVGVRAASMFVGARMDGRGDLALRGDRPLRHARAQQHAAARARHPRDGQGQRHPRPDSGVGGDLRLEGAAGADERGGAARAGFAFRAPIPRGGCGRISIGTSMGVRSKPTICRRFARCAATSSSPTTSCTTRAAATIASSI